MSSISTMSMLAEEASAPPRVAPAVATIAPAVAVAAVDDSVRAVRELRRDGAADGAAEAATEATTDCGGEQLGVGATELATEAYRELAAEGTRELALEFGRDTVLGEGCRDLPRAQRERRTVAVASCPSAAWRKGQGVGQGLD